MVTLLYGTLRVMSQHQAKKVREQKHLDHFLALQGIRPEAVRVGDPLDFILDLGDGRRVGVELVGVDNDAQIKNNLMADRLAQKVDAALREKGFVIQVQLLWKFDLIRFSENDKRINVFLNNLMAVINKEAPFLGDDAFVLSDDEENHQLQDLDLSELSDLVLQKMEHLTEPEVLSISMAWAKGESGFMAALRDKEDKLPAYRRILGDGDVWLLFVTGSRFEQNVYASLVKERELQSKFDRVFLLDLRDETVVTLK